MVTRKVLHIINQAFVLFLALQILNLSINSIDFQPFQTTNLTEFNDINTITEYVSEIVLGHTNAFPEFARKEEKQSQLQKHIDFKMLNPGNVFVSINFVKAPLLFTSLRKEPYSYQFFKEINPPPPKA